MAAQINQSTHTLVSFCEKKRRTRAVLRLSLLGEHWRVTYTNWRVTYTNFALIGSYIGF